MSSKYEPSPAGWPSLIQLGCEADGGSSTTACGRGAACEATGLLLTQWTYPADALGMLLEEVSSGVSSVEEDALVDHVVPGGVFATDDGLIQLCRCAATCGTAAVGPRLEPHVDCLREWSFDNVVEVWARREIVNRTEPPTPTDWPRDASATAHVGGDGSLPIDVGDEPPHSGRGMTQEQCRAEVEILKSRSIYLGKDVAGVVSDAALAHERDATCKRRSRSRSRRRRCTRRRKRSTLLSVTRTIGGGEDFREAPSRVCGSSGSAAVQIMTRPGRYYMSTMWEVSEHLSTRGGGAGTFARDAAICDPPGGGIPRPQRSRQSACANVGEMEGVSRELGRGGDGQRRIGGRFAYEPRRSSGDLSALRRTGDNEGFGRPDRSELRSDHPGGTTRGRHDGVAGPQAEGGVEEGRPRSAQMRNESRRGTLGGEWPNLDVESTRSRSPGNDYNPEDSFGSRGSIGSSASSVEDQSETCPGLDYQDRGRGRDDSDRRGCWRGCCFSSPNRSTVCVKTATCTHAGTKGCSTAGEAGGRNRSLTARRAHASGVDAGSARRATSGSFAVAAATSDALAADVNESTRSHAAATLSAGAWRMMGSESASAGMTWMELGDYGRDIRLQIPSSVGHLSGLCWPFANGEVTRIFSKPSRGKRCGRQHDALPLPLAVPSAEDMGTKAARGHCEQKVKRLTTWLLLLVLVLNFEYNLKGLELDAAFLQGTAVGAQDAGLTRLIGATWGLDRDGIEPLSQLDESVELANQCLSYSDAGIGVALRVTLEELLLALLRHGITRTTSAVDSAESEVKACLGDPGRVELMYAETTEKSPYLAEVWGDYDEWARIVVAPVERGVCGTLREADLWIRRGRAVVNRLLGGTKSKVDDVETPCGWLRALRPTMNLVPSNAWQRVLTGDLNEMALARIGQHVILREAEISMWSASDSRLRVVNDSFGSDASIRGEGVYIGREITTAGHAAWDRSNTEPDFGPASELYLIVSLCDEIDGARRTLESMRATLAVNVSAEVDIKVRLAVRPCGRLLGGLGDVTSVSRGRLLKAMVREYDGHAELMELEVIAITCEGFVVWFCVRAVTWVQRSDWYLVSEGSFVTLRDPLCTTDNCHVLIANQVWTSPGEWLEDDCLWSETLDDFRLPTAARRITRAEPLRCTTARAAFTTTETAGWTKDEWSLPQHHYWKEFHGWDNDDALRPPTDEKHDRLQEFATGRAVIVAPSSDARQNVRDTATRRSGLRTMAFNGVALGEILRPWAQQRGYMCKEERLLINDGTRGCDRNLTTWHRGSDVRLTAGEPMRPQTWSKRAAKHDCWLWQNILVTRWESTGRINEFEYRTALPTLRRRGRAVEQLAWRWLTPLDKVVAITNVNKMRSSPYELNCVTGEPLPRRLMRSGGSVSEGAEVSGPSGVPVCACCQQLAGIWMAWPRNDWLEQICPVCYNLRLGPGSWTSPGPNQANGGPICTLDVGTERIVATAAETLAATLLARTQVLPSETPEAAENADTEIDSSKSDTVSAIADVEVRTHTVAKCRRIERLHYSKIQTKIPPYKRVSGLHGLATSLRSVSATRDRWSLSGQK